MTGTSSPIPADKQGAEDSGRYFRYMAEFVSFTPEDAALIARTRPALEKRLPEIVTEFYDHLLRYPPTRQLFLKNDGTVDTDYVELRMRHLANFWLRTASGEYGDEYARYVDYVGRAHTSRGADPKIYVAERYVIGQVGFIQHTISRVLDEELHAGGDEEFAHQALEAWDKLMMVILEMLARAYGNEREPEGFAPLVAVPRDAVEQLAEHAVAHEMEESQGGGREVAVALTSEIPEGGRKIIEAAGISIGVFHHQGQWYALRNACLHRGGPVCTGEITGDELVCPWHGFRYDVTTGRLATDPAAALEMFAVTVRDGRVYVRVPEETDESVLPSLEPPAPPAPSASPPSPELPPDAFLTAEIAPGQMRKVSLEGEDVAVYNIGGTFYATQDSCTHAGGPLSEGDLEGAIVTCPIHGSCFDVTSGEVRSGPAKKPLRTYRVTVEGGIGRVVAAPGDA